MEPDAIDELDCILIDPPPCSVAVPACKKMFAPSSSAEFPASIWILVACVALATRRLISPEDPSEAIPVATEINAGSCATVEGIRMPILPDVAICDKPLTIDSFPPVESSLLPAFAWKALPTPSALSFPAIILILPETESVETPVANVAEPLAAKAAPVEKNAGPEFPSASVDIMFNSALLACLLLPERKWTDPPVLDVLIPLENSMPPVPDELLVKMAKFPPFSAAVPTSSAIAPEIPAPPVATLTLAEDADDSALPVDTATAPDEEPLPDSKLTAPPVSRELPATTYNEPLRSDEEPEKMTISSDPP